jgi:hypothetical protein
MIGSDRARLVESPSGPLLGLPDDPVTQFSFPSVSLRCRATDRPRLIELDHQAMFCLGPTYPECSRYRGAAAPTRSRSPIPTFAEPSGHPARDRPWPPGQQRRPRRAWRHQPGSLDRRVREQGPDPATDGTRVHCFVRLFARHDRPTVPGPNRARPRRGGGRNAQGHCGPVRRDGRRDRGRELDHGCAPDLRG